MDIFTVLKAIKKENSISEMSFHSYPNQTLIQDENKLTEIESKQLNDALSIRDKLGLPFWDSLMLTFFGNRSASSIFLSLSQRHNSNEIFFTSNISDIEKDICKSNKIIARRNLLQHLESKITQSLQ